MDIQGMQLGDVENGLPYVCDIERLVDTGPRNKRRQVVYRRVYCNIVSTREIVENEGAFTFMGWTVSLRLRPGQEIQTADTLVNIKSTRTGRKTFYDALSVTFVEYIGPYTFNLLCKESE